MRTLLLTMLMLALSVPAFARDNYKDNVLKFCSGASKKKTVKTHDNSNFKKPLPNLSYGEGTHTLEEGTTLTVYEGGAYVLQLGPKYFGARGTSYDDMMLGSQKIGGCSAEQMSEAIRNNKILVDEPETAPEATTNEPSQTQMPTGFHH